jgi:hypothetical protein
MFYQPKCNPGAHDNDGERHVHLNRELIKIMVRGTFICKRKLTIMIMRGRYT